MSECVCEKTSLERVLGCKLPVDHVIEARRLQPTPLSGVREMCVQI